MPPATRLGTRARRIVQRPSLLDLGHGLIDQRTGEPVARVGVYVARTHRPPLGGLRYGQSGRRWLGPLPGRRSFEDRREKSPAEAGLFNKCY